MAEQRRVITSRLRPTFTPGVDLLTRLTSYSDTRFTLQLLSTGPDVAGELFCKGAAGHAEHLLLKTTGVERNLDRDDLASVVANNLAVELECEKQIFAEPASFSFSEGVFELSRTINCDQNALPIATQLLTEHFALPFLQTLGNLTGLDPA